MVWQGCEVSHCDFGAISTIQSPKMGFGFPVSKIFWSGSIFLAPSRFRFWVLISEIGDVD